MLLDDVRFAFQPLVNVRIGGIVAVEALARSRGRDVEELFGGAQREGELTEWDGLLAARAVADFAEHGTWLPLHVNVLARTVVHDPARIDAVRETLSKLGRREQEVTLEIGPPVSGLADGLLTGVKYLRDCGFRIALDHVGGGEVPLELVAELRPDMVKLDRRLLHRLSQRQHRMAVLDSVRQICDSIGTTLLVDGVDDEQHLALLRQHGVPLAQGDLLGPADWRPPHSLAVSNTLIDLHDPATSPVDAGTAGPRVAEFLCPATMLPSSASADDVRAAFADRPEISGVVLVDEDRRPQRTIDRNRFLLAVTGPYGHALHAKKPASRLADKPRLVTTSTTAVEALELVTQSERDRFNDDAVVVDESGRCLGVVPAGTLVRGMADLKVEEAAALSPLTRLPGSDSLAREVGRRVDHGREFALSWLDINAFKSVNDTVGFAAGDDLIRGIGRSLTDAAASLDSVRVAHPGGDDFLIVADPDDLFPLAKRLLDPPRDADGVPVTLSLATLVCSPTSTTSYGEASRRLAPLKRFAKSLHGAAWVLSRPDTDRIDILRGQRHDIEGGSDRRAVAAQNTAAERSDQRFDLFAVAPVGIGVFDESERLVQANSALATLLGYRLDQLHGMSLEDLAHPQDAVGTSRTGPTPADGRRDQTVSQRLLVRSDGQPVHCELHSALSMRNDGSQCWVVVFHDITQRHRVAEALRHQANHDNLTGLPNRAAAKQMLGEALSDTDPARVAVLLCDIDNFKRINDSLGHDAGDDLLVALARRLDSGLPPGCTPAKLPSDEFLVICSDIDGVGGIDSLAITVSSLLRASVPLHGQLVRVSSSIGAATPSQSGTSADDLLRFADAAMFQAKRRGSGRVSLAGPALMTSADRQLQLEGQLREALHNDGLSLHYQPMADQDGTVVSVEALVRWPHPDRGLLAPGVFLPVAEQGDLLRDLDRWVLAAALREACGWRDLNGHPVGVAVNLGGLMPDGPDFVDEVADIIAESGIDRERVILELVETTLFDLPSRARAAMHRLAERGVRFAIDDFGTGYSSLARLKDLPAQIIKTDRGLVSGVATNPSDLAIARAVVDMARAMGRSCVAEGVETATQFRLLRGLGVDVYQGRLLSHPLPAHELRTVLSTGSLPIPDIS